MVNIHKNMRLREAVTTALALGCSVRVEGEVIIKHPTWKNAARVKGSRHDTPQPLVSRLRKLAKQLGVKP